MPIFISYSHQDKEFVDRLAKQLVVQGVSVWLDRWELSIGDSIIEKVQTALDGSSALLVIISKASEKSQWCSREINAGFIKELQEKRVFVLPVLLENCSIPLFARDKLYADFRTSFDDGLRVIVEGVAKITNQNLARFIEPEYYTDHAVDYQFNGKMFTTRLTYIDHVLSQPYSCLTEIIITRKCSNNPKLSREQYLGNDDGALSRFKAIEALYITVKGNHPLRVTLSDELPIILSKKCKGTDGAIYDATISARRLGEDTGRDILLTLSSNIERTYIHHKEILRLK